MQYSRHQAFNKFSPMANTRVSTLLIEKFSSATTAAVNASFSCFSHVIVASKSTVVAGNFFSQKIFKLVRC